MSNFSNWLFILLLAFALLANAQKNNGKLISAVEKGNYEKVEKLLSTGAYVNSCKKTKIINRLNYFDKDNYSVTTDDSRISKISGFQLYADNGNVSLKGINISENEVGISTINGSASIYEAIDMQLPKQKFAITPVNMAIEQGDTAILKLLIKQGADLNTSYQYRKSISHYPLQYALNKVFSLDYEQDRKLVALRIVSILLENGANPNVSSSNKYTTPLHYAIRLADIRLLKKLIDSGANFSYAEQVTDNGSLIDFTVKLSFVSNIEILTFLFDRGLKPKDNYLLFYPIDNYSTSEHFDVLVKNGVDINTIYQGKLHCVSPLSYALYLKNPYYAKKIVNNGANLHTCNAFENALLLGNRQRDDSYIVLKMASDRVALKDTSALLKYFIDNNITSADSLLYAYNIDSTIIKQLRNEKLNEVAINKQKKLEQDIIDQKLKDAEREKYENSFAYRFKYVYKFNTLVLKPALMYTDKRFGVELCIGLQDYVNGRGFLNFEEHYFGPYLGSELHFEKDNLIWAPKIGIDYSGILFGWRANALLAIDDDRYSLIVRPEIGISFINLVFSFGYSIPITTPHIIDSGFSFSVLFNIGK
ncbi:MAG: hypothetical protein IPO21_07825 [Bacteroidales bacterium]|nr:hypothetical protein [Bacteroidales bacterium]